MQVPPFYIMRVFFCLAPNPDVCLEMHRWRTLCWPGLARPIPARHLHLTLAFLGELTSTQLDSLTRRVDSLHWSGFDLRLNQIGYWSRPDVLWVGPDSPCDPVERLAEQCRAIAHRESIRVKGQGFVPHITLARRLKDPPSAPLIDPDFVLSADHLLLMQSTLHPGGSIYRELACWNATA